jgi:hypothetical protein
MARSHSGVSTIMQKSHSRILVTTATIPIDSHACVCWFTRCMRVHMRTYIHSLIRTGFKLPEKYGTRPDRSCCFYDPTLATPPTRSIETRRDLTSITDESWSSPPARAQRLIISWPTNTRYEPVKAIRRRTTRSLNGFSVLLALLHHGS